ncbi:hypothetical protein ABFX02_01G026100 [Erythranthe guttata]
MGKIERINGGECIVIIFMAVLVLLTNGVHGKSTYACWGGCYNECFLKTGLVKTQSNALSCDYQCLNNCVPRSASDFMYYCEIGCSLKRCIPVAYDGAKLERCFGFCTNLCKKLIAP